MISSIDITGVKMDLDEKTKKYVTKKIGRLDRFLPRHARKSAKADVKLRFTDKPNGNKYRVDVVLTVPDKKIVADEMAPNVLAAVDIVEAKLATQLRKYKTTALPHLGLRKVLSKFKRSYSREK